SEVVMSRRCIIAIVVAVIVLACSGMLVTGVCRVREAAARMNCHSHFKGWAVALHHYADANPVTHDDRAIGQVGNAFPAGTVPNAALPPEQRLSWCVP